MDEHIINNPKYNFLPIIKVAACVQETLRSKKTDKMPNRYYKYTTSSQRSFYSKAKYEHDVHRKIKYMIIKKIQLRTLNMINKYDISKDLLEVENTMDSMLYKLYKYNSLEQMLTVYKKILFQSLTIVHEWFRFKTLYTDINNIFRKYMPDYHVIYDNQDVLLKSLLVQIIPNEKTVFNNILKIIKENNYDTSNNNNIFYHLFQKEIDDIIYKIIVEFTLNNINKELTLCINSLTVD